MAYYTTAASGAAATHFEHQDWLGTERLRTSYNGAVEGSYSNLPFGDGQATNGVDNDASHFATLDHDAETDTDHAEFRQYSDTQGRWLSPDPYSGSYNLANPQSMNRYVYALNNPLSNIDPSGLDCVYTHSDGSYLIETGDCASPDDDGVFADGSATFKGAEIDPNTGAILQLDFYVTQASTNIDATFNGSTGQISFSDPSVFGSFIGTSSAGNGSVGGGGGGAPNYGAILALTKKALTCHASALKKEGIALATDALGMVPGESTGLRIAQLTGVGVGFVNGLVKKDASGAVGNIVGGQTIGVGWAAKSMGVTALEAVPVAGNFLSAGFFVRDLVNEAQDAYSCLGGS